MTHDEKKQLENKDYNEEDYFVSDDEYDGDTEEDVPGEELYSTIAEAIQKYALYVPGELPDEIDCMRSMINDVWWSESAKTLEERMANAKPDAVYEAKAVKALQQWVKILRKENAELKRLLAEKDSK